MALDTAFIESLSTTHAHDFRRFYRAMGALPGVSSGFSLNVTQRAAGANMSVDVAPGFALVPGTEFASLNDVWPVASDAITNVAIAGANPTNPRRDAIVLRVQDPEISGATAAKTISVVTGTPAASPVLQPLPTNSMLLADVRVNAAATSVVNANITDRRTRMAFPGRVIGSGAPVGDSTPVAGPHAVAGVSATFEMPTLPTGRFVKVEFDAPYVVTATPQAGFDIDVATVTLTDDADVAFTTKKVKLTTNANGVTNSGCHMMIAFNNTRLAAGPHTIKVWINSSSAATGLGGFTGLQHILVTYV